MSERFEIFESEPPGAFGIKSVPTRTGFAGGTLYEPDMTRECAVAVCKMYNSSNPPSEWFEARSRLIRMGISPDVVDVDHLSPDLDAARQEADDA